MRKKMLCVSTAVLLLLCLLTGCMSQNTVPGDLPTPTEEATATPIPAIQTTLPPKETDEPAPSPTDAGIPQEVLDVQALIAKNPDCIGRVYIPDTKVDNPVMYKPDQIEYYLTRDFNGKHSTAGALYLDESCKVEPRSANWIVYGHHMKNGTMFAGLCEYKKEEYFKAHPYVYFVTATEVVKYEIFSCFNGEILQKKDKGYRFYYFFDAEDEAEFNENIEQYCKKSLYDTGVTPVYGEEILTLITCEYTYDNGRMVVAARRVNE